MLSKEKKGLEQKDEIRKEAIILGNLLVKHDVLSTFFIPCSIESRKFEHVMLDFRVCYKHHSALVYYNFNIISCHLLIYVNAIS